jgi:hypothetical protein
MLCLIAVGGIGSALLLLFALNDSRLSPDTQQETGPIRIACSEVWMGYVPLVMSVDRFFNENDVSVQLIQPENQTEAEELYLNGFVDGLCTIYTTTIFHNSEGANSKWYGFWTTRTRLMLY